MNKELKYVHCYLISYIIDYSFIQCSNYIIQCSNYIIDNVLDIKVIVCEKEITKLALLSHFLPISFISFIPINGQLVDGVTHFLKVSFLAYSYM